MRINDKKILATAYFDRALTSEEKQWAESACLHDSEIKDYLKDCQKISDFTHQNLISPEMPHTLEYNWQKFRSTLRQTPSAFCWKTIFSPLWLPKLAWSALSLIVIVSLGFWQFKPSNSSPLLVQNETLPNSSVQTITLPVSYEKNLSVDKVWSPKPEISVTSFRSGKGKVIWLTGMPYRSETNVIK